MSKPLYKKRVGNVKIEVYENRVTYGKRGLLGWKETVIPKAKISGVELGSVTKKIVIHTDSGDYTMSAGFSGNKIRDAILDIL